MFREITSTLESQLDQLIHSKQVSNTELMAIDSFLAEGSLAAAHYHSLVSDHFTIGYRAYRMDCDVRHETGHTQVMYRINNSVWMNELDTTIEILSLF